MGGGEGLKRPELRNTEKCKRLIFEKSLIKSFPPYITRGEQTAPAGVAMERQGRREGKKRGRGGEESGQGELIKRDRVVDRVVDAGVARMVQGGIDRVEMTRNWGRVEVKEHTHIIDGNTLPSPPLVANQYRNISHCNPNYSDNHHYTTRYVYNVKNTDNNDSLHGPLLLRSKCLWYSVNENTLFFVVVT